MVALRLSHVSSRWNSIAKSSASFWKEIDAIKTEFAVFCSELASVDLEVSLHLSIGQESKPRHIIESACHFILQNAYRISTLIVFGSHPLLEIFLSTPFPELTTSIFDFSRRLGVSRLLLDNLPNLALFGGHAPKLQDVAWTCVRIPSLSRTPWSNLTTLELDLDWYFHDDDVFNWTEFLSLLSRNPNLETLNIGVPRSESHLIPVPIPLLSLQKAKISVYNMQDLKILFREIFAPKIQSINIAIAQGTSFSNLFSTLGRQDSLLSLLKGIEGCEIKPMSDVYMRCWNVHNQTTFEITFSLMDPEEDASDLANLLPAVKQLSLEWIPPQFKLPPLPSVTVLTLLKCNFGNAWRVDADTFPSLSTIILARPPGVWWGRLLEALNHLIGSSRTVQNVISSGYHLMENEQRLLEQICKIHGVLWRYDGVHEQESGGASR
ncbi:hypothetical protein M422DRAFT_243621 [Sphaerobolus stellatus SS14]|nr:hypothetical protein M422DRAFT_243621 [Sphaerobolus stellatus SS14]